MCLCVLSFPLPVSSPDFETKISGLCLIPVCLHHAQHHPSTKRGSMNIRVQWTQRAPCPTSEEVKALCPCHSLPNPSVSLKRELGTEQRNHCLCSGDSQPGRFGLPAGIWPCLEIIVAHWAGEMLLAPSGWESGMLLNIPWCTGQHPTTRNYPSWKVLSESSRISVRFQQEIIDTELGFWN